jgi:hypothetical protein
VPLEQERSQQRQYNKEQCKELINLGDKVKATLLTNGWVEVIEPLLNKMIIDVLGGMENGRWHNGSLDRSRKDERKEFLLGYKAALVNLHSAVYSYLDEAETAKETIKDLNVEATATYEIPMTSGPYSGKETDEGGY